MKVCTDSCLFGAWIADKCGQKLINPKKILDIGAGTGLLSLMVAQKSNAVIDAVEIDENAYQQTLENFDASPWSERLQVINADIKNWHPESKYDLIISNPPFFENDLKGAKQNNNIAKHDDGLTFIELILSIKNKLIPGGNFSVLLPFHRVDFFKKLAAANGFYLMEQLLIRQTPRHDYFRGILFFGSGPVNSISNELTIKNTEGKYTAEFENLLKDYYLVFS